MRSLRQAVWATSFGVFILIGLAEVSSRLFLRHRGLTWTERVAAEHQLLAPKKTHEKRVFIFGASSVVGYHHLGQSSLSTALDFLCRRAGPDQTYRVVNFGKAGEASDFVVTAAKDSLRYHPDLVVIYAGENEFIPSALLRRRARYRLERALLHSKLLRVLKEALGQPADLSMPDFRRYSYQSLVQDVAQNQTALLSDFKKRFESFDKSLGRETTAVYLAPVGNSLWPPSFHDDFENIVYDMRLPAERDFVDGVVLEQKGDDHGAAQLFERVLKAVPEFSDNHFRLASCSMRLGRRPEAAMHFQQAIDYDLVPNRATTATHAILRDTAKKGHYVDVTPKLKAASQKPWIDYDWVEDNCHPTISLEWTLAWSVLSLAEVQAPLGWSKPLGPVNVTAYLRERRIDRAVEARMDMRIGQYHAGRESGARWFLKALELAPGDSTVIAAYKTYQSDAKALREKRDFFLRKVLAQAPSGQARQRE